MLVRAAAPATQPPANRRPLAIAAIGAGVAVAALVALVVAHPASVRARAATAQPSVPISGGSPAAGENAAGPGSVVDPEDQTRSALAAYRNGDLNSAITQLTAAVEANPSDASALNNLGQALVRANRASDAVPYFDRAVEQSPATWAFQFNRARAYEVIAAWPQAIAGYRRAAELFPEDYATRFNLAHALQANGDLEEAIESYQKAVSLAPGQPDFLLSLAGAQELAHRGPDAVATYRRFLELEPASPEAEKIKDRIARLSS